MTMTTIYIHYVDELEGMFDQEGKLLGAWSCDDATWRNEYFRGFMSRLGYEVKRLPTEMIPKAKADILAHFGLEDSE